MSNDNIPTHEIEQDIADTQNEIDQYQRELDVLMENTQGNKVAIYMRQGMISVRKSFIDKLNSILEQRK